MQLRGRISNGIKWCLERSSNENRLYLEFRDHDNRQVQVGDVFVYLPALPILAPSKNSLRLNTDEMDEDWPSIFSRITGLPQDFLLMLYRNDIWYS